MPKVLFHQHNKKKIQKKMYILLTVDKHAMRNLKNIICSQGKFTHQYNFLMGIQVLFDCIYFIHFKLIYLMYYYI